MRVLRAKRSLNPPPGFTGIQYMKRTLNLEGDSPKRVRIYLEIVIINKFDGTIIVEYGDRKKTRKENPIFDFNVGFCDTFRRDTIFNFNDEFDHDNKNLTISIYDDLANESAFWAVTNFFVEIFDVCRINSYPLNGNQCVCKDEFTPVQVPSCSKNTFRNTYCFVCVPCNKKQISCSSTNVTCLDGLKLLNGSCVAESGEKIILK